MVSNNKPIESSHFRMFQSRHGKVFMFALMFALAAGTPMMQLKVDCGEDTLVEHNTSSLFYQVVLLFLVQLISKTSRPFFYS